jgi:hypothetical protein
MELARLWREHVDAGYPDEMAGLQIAGSEVRVLDAEISACARALLSRSFTVDGRIQRRLTEISAALLDQQAGASEPVATYCARLNELVSAVLVASRNGTA